MKSILYRLAALAITRAIGPLPTQAELDAILAEVWPDESE